MQFPINQLLLIGSIFVGACSGQKTIVSSPEPFNELTNQAIEVTLDLEGKTETEVLAELDGIIGKEGNLIDPHTHQGNFSGKLNNFISVPTPATDSGTPAHVIYKWKTEHHQTYFTGINGAAPDPPGLITEVSLLAMSQLRGTDAASKWSDIVDGAPTGILIDREASDQEQPVLWGTSAGPGWWAVIDFTFPDAAFLIESGTCRQTLVNYSKHPHIGLAELKINSDVGVDEGRKQLHQWASHVVRTGVLQKVDKVTILIALHTYDSSNPVVLDKSHWIIGGFDENHEPADPS